MVYAHFGEYNFGEFRAMPTLPKKIRQRGHRFSPNWVALFGEKNDDYNR